MGKNKLQRFTDIEDFSNVLELTDYENPNVEKPKGRWNTDILGNQCPVTLELACGKGEYAIELARRNPDRNFIGVDIKGARIWKGAKRALDEGLDNLCFLRIYADHLHEYFAPEEVNELWITFPDPYPKGSDRSKRLSSPKFLSIYQKVLAPGGVINFKTDSKALFEYTNKVVKKHKCRVREIVEHIYEERPDDPTLTIKTYYERKHLENGKTIKYIKFQLPEEEIRCED